MRPCLPPRSFPQGFRGNPEFFSSGLSFVRPCMGKGRGFPIEDVGNDRGGRLGMTEGERSGVTEGELCGPASPGGHSRRVLAGIQGFSLLAFHSCGLAWEKPVDSRLRMSGMTEGEGRE